MIEIHCWVTLRYSDYDSEDEPQKLFISKFKQFLQDKFDWLLEHNSCQIISTNGLECFSLHKHHNHKGYDFYPLEILEWIAREGKGSYGMLYFQDDEDKEKPNEFQVYILKRGKVLKHEDKFLSPYFPEIEKEYDELNPPKD